MAEYEPDFIERNGAWVLSMVGVVGTCCSGMLIYMIKSRCTRIKFGCLECERAVLDLSAVDVQTRT